MQISSNYLKGGADICHLSGTGGQVPEYWKGTPSASSCIKYIVVLVSAGIELIFFLVAGTVLCFGFSVRIMLITH